MFSLPTVSVGDPATEKATFGTVHRRFVSTCGDVITQHAMTFTTWPCLSDMERTPV